MSENEQVELEAKLSPIVKKAVKEAIDEQMSNQSVGLSQSGYNQSFSINEIDNGFLVESYGGKKHKRVFAETKEKAFELAREY